MSYPFCPLLFHIAMQEFSSLFQYDFKNGLNRFRGKRVYGSVYFYLPVSNMLYDVIIIYFQDFVQMFAILLVNVVMYLFK